MITRSLHSLGMPLCIGLIGALAPKLGRSGGGGRWPPAFGSTAHRPGRRIGHRMQRLIHGQHIVGAYAAAGLAGFGELCGQVLVELSLDRHFGGWINYTRGTFPARLCVPPYCSPDSPTAFGTKLRHSWGQSSERTVPIDSIDCEPPPQAQCRTEPWTEPQTELRTD